MQSSAAWVAAVLLALGAGVPVANAEKPPAEPRAPKNIDATPPLIPIPNARVTGDGLLIGGQPSREQLKQIRDAGYRTVVTLRPEAERGDEGERALVERLGMKFVSIPVPGASGLTAPNARALARAISAQDALPAVVHCSTGQRVSALLGLKAFVVDRVSAVEAINIAKGLGMKKFEAALRERLKEICRTDESRSCEGIR